MKHIWGWELLLCWRYIPGLGLAYRYLVRYPLHLQPLELLASEMRLALSSQYGLVDHMRRKVSSEWLSYLSHGGRSNKRVGRDGIDHLSEVAMIGIRCLDLSTVIPGRKGGVRRRRSARKRVRSAYSNIRIEGSCRGLRLLKI